MASNILVFISENTKPNIPRQTIPKQQIIPKYEFPEKDLKQKVLSITQLLIGSEICHQVSFKSYDSVFDIIIDNPKNLPIAANFNYLTSLGMDPFEYKYIAKIVGFSEFVKIPVVSIDPGKIKIIMDCFNLRNFSHYEVQSFKPPETLIQLGLIQHLLLHFNSNERAFLTSELNKNLPSSITKQIIPFIDEWAHCYKLFNK